MTNWRWVNSDCKLVVVQIESHQLHGVSSISVCLPVSTPRNVGARQPTDQSQHHSAHARRSRRFNTGPRRCATLDRQFHGRCEPSNQAHAAFVGPGVRQQGVILPLEQRLEIGSLVRRRELMGVDRPGQRRELESPLQGVSVALPATPGARSDA
jgi:hypothetical protein